MRAYPPLICSLNLRYCWSYRGVAAVQALSRASGLERLSLCICSGDGKRDTDEQGLPASSSHYYNPHDNIELPPMTCLAPVLTELRLLCYARLPWDWPWLSKLRRLHVHRWQLDGSWRPSYLAYLRQLTMLRIDAQPPGGCPLKCAATLFTLSCSRKGCKAVKCGSTLGSRRQALLAEGRTFRSIRRCDGRCCNSATPAAAADTLAALPALKELQLFRSSMRSSRYHYLDGKLASLPGPSAPDFEAELAQKLPNVALTWMD